MHEELTTADTHEIMIQVDDYVLSECSARDTALYASQDACAQAGDAKRQAEERLSSMADEFAKQESELISSAKYQRQCEERAQQVQVLELELGRLRHDAVAVSDMQKQLRVAEVERNRLRSLLDRGEQQRLDLMDRANNLELELEAARNDLVVLQEERDALFTEFNGLLEQLKRQGVSVRFKAGQLDLENKQLRERVRELEASLSRKEQSILGIRSELDDQVGPNGQ